MLARLGHRQLVVACPDVVDSLRSTPGWPGEGADLGLRVVNSGGQGVSALGAELANQELVYVGSLGWHQAAALAALDDRVRLPDENPSIGMILCREKKRAIVEYALKESNKPIGVAAYRIVRRLPAELKGKLPEPKQIERLLEAMELPRGKEGADSGEGA